MLGPAGSGKTSLIEEAVDDVVLNEGRVLITAPTGKLAAHFRQKYPNLDVDTIHGAFQIWKSIEQTLELMIPYDLIIVEEVGQLSRGIFERLMELWKSAEKLPTLVFVGDFWQLPGVEGSKAIQSPMWRNTGLLRVRELHTMRRCKCQILADKLRILRTGKPSKAQLMFILRGHKAPTARMHARMYEPTAWDILKILEETPHTTFLTISRRAAFQINVWAVEALFGNQPPLCYVDVAADGDEENEKPKTHI